MTMSKLLASAAVAASLVSAPVVAQAAAAERTATEVEGESLAGGFLRLVEDGKPGRLRCLRSGR